MGFRSVKNRCCVIQGPSGKVIQVYSDMIEDPGQHGLIRLKAAQLASELAKEIFRTSEEGVIKVKDRVKSDLSDWNMNFGLRNYLMYRDPKTGEIRDVDDDYEIEEPRTVAEW